MKYYVEQIIKEQQLAVLIKDLKPLVVDLALLPANIKETDLLEYRNGKYYLVSNNEEIKKAQNAQIEALLKQIVKPMPKK